MTYFISRSIDEHSQPPVLELIGQGSPTSISAAVGAGSIAIQTDAGAGAGLWVYTAGSWVQAGAAGASGPPTGAAGGDLLGSTYPNPVLIATGPGVTGPIGGATIVPVITIDAKGRVTALTSATISTGGGGSGGGAGADFLLYQSHLVI